MKTQIKFPLVIGKVKSNIRAAVAVVIAIFVALLMTGFGYQPIWITIMIAIVAILLFVPFSNSDYWMINEHNIEAHRYSDLMLDKAIQILLNRNSSTIYEYKDIQSITINYVNKQHFSGLDINPDMFTLVIKISDGVETVSISKNAVDDLPMLTEFWSDQGIVISDERHVIDAIKSHKNLYSAMH